MVVINICAHRAKLHLHTLINQVFWDQNAWFETTKLGHFVHKTSGLHSVIKLRETTDQWDCIQAYKELNVNDRFLKVFRNSRLNLTTNQNRY